MFVFSLTGRRMHIDDQRFKAELSQRHGGGDTNRSGSGDDDVISQIYISP
jgi:hypothetical protein